MTRLWAITTREYASMFRIPLGWIAVALFLLLSGVLFVEQSVRPGEPASMRGFFQLWWLLLLILAPLTSMRLFSEEIRTGTLEPMLTAPVHEASIVVGKYLAAMLLLITMIAPTLVYVGVLEGLSRPDYGPIIAGYLGVVLLGMLYLAIGTLVSAFTSSQMLAGLGTFFLLLAVEIAPKRAADVLPDRLASAAYAVMPSLRLAQFAKGLISTGDVAFFIVGSLWFLAMATIVLETRRWR